MENNLSNTSKRFNRKASHSRGCLLLLPLMMMCAMLTACSEKHSGERSMVEEWIGKEILFPEEMNFQIQDIPVEYDPWSADYRILTYIDSMGCTSCKMKLRQWDELIDMFKAIPDVDVNFLMVVDDTVTTEIVGDTKKRNVPQSCVLRCRPRFLIP